MEPKQMQRKHLTAEILSTVMWEALALKLMTTGNHCLPGHLNEQPADVTRDFLALAQKEADRWNKK